MPLFDKCQNQRDRNLKLVFVGRMAVLSGCVLPDEIVIRIALPFGPLKFVLKAPTERHIPAQVVRPVANANPHFIKLDRFLKAAQKAFDLKQLRLKGETTATEAEYFYIRCNGSKSSPLKRI